MNGLQDLNNDVNIKLNPLCGVSDIHSDTTVLWFIVIVVFLKSGCLFYSLTPDKCMEPLNQTN